MHWEHPPLIKIYEALGTLADGRIELAEHGARVFSSSGNKFYVVTYDEETGAMMANDNGSYWQGYLGYPSIAYLFLTGALPLKKKFADLLKGVRWKDLNVEYKNDFQKTLAHIDRDLGEEKAQLLRAYAEEVAEIIAQKPILVLGKKLRPPTGY